MLHGDHVGKLTRRLIDPIKQEKNIGDEPRLDVLIELTVEEAFVEKVLCGFCGGVCREGVCREGVCRRCLKEVFVEESVVVVLLWECGSCVKKHDDRTQVSIYKQIFLAAIIHHLGQGLFGYDAKV